MRDKDIEASAAAQEMFARDAGIGVPEMSDRDLACLVLRDLDYEAQLIAIVDLLRHHELADERTRTWINELEELARKSGGLRDQREVDQWVDLLHGSTYQSAGHSMAAVGMLAPLIESLFYEAFKGIRVRYYDAGVIPQGHVRSGMTKADNFWDCHLVYSPTTTAKFARSLVLGILELAEAIELMPHLPANSKSVLEPLFQYRNKMFHCGFEWPADECASFGERIAKENWQAWFSSATRDGVPFIFYMTDELIDHSFGLVHELLDGLGAYCRQKRPIAGLPVE